MRLFILSAFLVFASCNTLTIEGQLFDKVWELSTVNGAEATNCRQMERLLFDDNAGTLTVSVWPLCPQYPVNSYPLIIEGDVLRFHDVTFVIQDITETRLVMTLGPAEWVYYSL